MLAAGEVTGRARADLAALLQVLDLPEDDLSLAAALRSPLFGWSEEEFLGRTAGSAIRRIGHERWLRNIAVALGNAAPDPGARAALEARTDHPSALVREHVGWALARHDRARHRLAHAPPALRRRPHCRVARRQNHRPSPRLDLPAGFGGPRQPLPSGAV
jgi:hypothetical protein